MVMMTNPFVKFPNQPTDNFFERLGGSTLKAPSSDEVGETSGTDETRTLGVTASRYRGGIKIATGSALIGQTLSPTKGIKFELKRTGLSGVHSASRFEIWNDTTIISSATVTFQPDTKVGTSYAYVEFFPASTVTLQANDRITIATDGGVTNYYTFRSNASGSYDTTKTHWTESTWNSGSGGTWTDETGRDGNFKFTLVTQQPSIKQHFIEWFSGKQLPSYWTNNLSGSASHGMSDEVDGGFKMTCPNSTHGGLELNFNQIKQYNLASSTVIAVMKKTDLVTTGWLNVGCTDNANIGADASNNYSCKYHQSSSAYVIGRSGDGTTTTETTSTLGLMDTNFHSYKSESSGSQILYVMDSITEVTKTTNMPTGKGQPAMRVGMNTAHSGGSTAQIRYLEAYNT